jgi:hypothetical protein
MTRLLQFTGSSIIVRRTNGYEALNTARPMPAQVGSFNKSNITVAYPQTPGEVLHGEYVSSTGSFRYWTDTPAHNGNHSLDLGAFTGSDSPSIIYGKVRIRRTLAGGNVTGLLEAPLALNEWLQWPGGSLLLEHFGQANKIWMWRHIDISVSGGRWRLNYRQGNDHYKTSKSYSGVRASTASTFSIDLQLGWGVFR